MSLISRDDMNKFLSHALMNAKDIPLDFWGGGTVTLSYDAEAEVLNVWHRPASRDADSGDWHFKLVPVRQAWEEVTD